MTEKGLDLKPRTVAELLDAAFVVYRRLFWKLLIAATLVSLPTLILAGVYANDVADFMRDYGEWMLGMLQRGEQFAGEEFWDEYWDQVFGQVVFGYGQELLMSMSRGGGMAVMAVATWYVVRRKRMPSAWALCREALPRLPAAIFAHFVLRQIAGMTCACPPLGVLTYVVLIPSAAIMMLERGTLETRVRAGLEQVGPVGRLFRRSVLIPITIGLDGLVRSVTLSFDAPALGRGTLFATFLFLFVSLFVAGVSAATGFLVPLVGLESYGLVFWINHYAEVVTLPALGVGVTLWYFDLRARREGLDLLAVTGDPA